MISPVMPLVRLSSGKETMDALFYYVLNMGMTAALIGLPICLLRRIRQVPRFLIHLSWSFVGIRLLLPFTFSSSISLLSAGGRLVKRLVPLPMETGPAGGLSFSNLVGTASSYYPLRQGSEALQALFHVMAVIWAIVAGIIIVAVVVAHAASSHALAKSVHIRENRWYSPLIASPVVSGLFRQRIILPDGFPADAGELAHVDRHEQVHMKRHDNLARLLSILLLAVHWCNPIVWLYLRWFFEDMELSCDAGAVRDLAPEERKRYAKALVNLGAGHRAFPNAAFAGTAGLKVKRRITAVMDGMRHPLPIILLFALFFVILGVSLLSNPVMPFHPISGGLPVVEVQNALSSYYRPPFQPAEGVTEAQAKTLCLSWLQQHGYGELMEDSLQVSDCTREEGWNNEKLQVFAVSGFGWDSGIVIIQDGKVLSVLSGMPLQFSWLADLDADGLYEFYGNAMFGSGIVNMEVIGFNLSNVKQYRLSNRMKEDYRLYVRDGMLVVDVMPYSPAGPGSSDERVTRRLVLDRGNLALEPVDPQ